MSVTVEDLLKLPCLQEARVLAGRKGLSKVVTSVSVLEYANPGSTSECFYQSNQWSGGELVVSALAGIRDDLDAQCWSIRWMAGVGEVGLVLYYVGVLLPKVDHRVIELCDELDFTLILMPERRLDLRYSEVICEVMEAVFKDQQAESSLVSDILERVSHLPEHQRTVDTVLRMVSDRLRACAVLTDQRRRILGGAAWPQTLEPRLEELAQRAAEAGGPGVFRCPILTRDSGPMELFLLKEANPLSPELSRQAGEVVQLAVNIWSSQHAEVMVSELVRAILRDEPMKMRRLADIFHIDVASIQSMWVLREAEAGAREPFQSRALAMARDCLSPHCKTVVADRYEGYVVAFMDWPVHDLEGAALGSSLCVQLREEGFSPVLTRCHELKSTADVRAAFLLNDQYLDAARLIWPDRDCHTLQEIIFARDCRTDLEAGEAAASARLAVLSPLAQEREGGELRRTLSVYLLDAEGNVGRCAALLFLHKNTVKYRLGRIEARLGHSVDKLPEQFALYHACALSRLLENP